MLMALCDRLDLSIQRLNAPNNSSALVYLYAAITSRYAGSILAHPAAKRVVQLCRGTP